VQDRECKNKKKCVNLKKREKESVHACVFECLREKDRERECVLDRESG
jgi:hypothetical protein